MKRKSGKRPANQRRPRSKKQPQSPAELDYRKLSVHWSFKIMDLTCCWSDETYNGDTFCEIAAHLRDFEGRTWGQIESDRSRQHPVWRDRLILDAQKRLSQIKQDDVDSLWRFRFTGQKRLWGIRDGRVFKVIWWDPQHCICP